MDDSRELYELDSEGRLVPQRKEGGLQRRWDDLENPSARDLYRMILDTGKQQLESQKSFSAEVNKLSERIAKYNGLWAHQDKQDAQMEKLTDTIALVAKSHALCQERQQERTRTYDNLRSWGGWVFGVASTILGIIIGVKSFVGR